MRPDPRSGFTLVEVLATLMITAAFCVVVLPFAARLAGRWWWGETRVETADAWMQAVARLSDDLAQAVPISVQRGDNAVVDFVAGADFVQFVRPALESSSRTGLDTVRLEIRSSGDGQILVRRSGPFRPEAADLGAATTILSGRFRLRFRAFGRDHELRNTWDDEADMPVGIELSAVGTRSGALPPGPILLPIVARAASRKQASAESSDHP